MGIISVVLVLAIIVGFAYLTSFKLVINKDNQEILEKNFEEPEHIIINAKNFEEAVSIIEDAGTESVSHILVSMNSNKEPAFIYKRPENSEYGLCSIEEISTPLKYLLPYIKDDQKFIVEIMPCKDIPLFSGEDLEKFIEDTLESVFKGIDMSNVVIASFIPQHISIIKSLYPEVLTGVMVTDCTRENMFGENKKLAKSLTRLTFVRGANPDTVFFYKGEYSALNWGLFEKMNKHLIIFVY